MVKIGCGDAGHDAAWAKRYGRLLRAVLEYFITEREDQSAIMEARVERLCCNRAFVGIKSFSGEQMR